MDKLETFHDSLIQHGPFNDRVYLMKMGRRGKRKSAELINHIEGLAEREGYSKIFIKTSESATSPFEEADYEVEARVPGLYRGKEEALFMVKYLDEKRRQLKDPEKVERILSLAKEKAATSEDSTAGALPFKVRELDPSDAPAMANIYQCVFKTYPFPIHDPKYLVKAMHDNVRSFGVFEGGRLIAVAACELDEENGNVEMTDFATLPECRGKNIAQLILRHMERVMSESGIKTAYTIARSHSYGMNITFSKLGYQFSGTLRNNTNIAGEIEPMNVWYRPLKEHGQSISTHAG